MPYPTATIYVPWDALGDGDGIIDAARLPANVALTDADETFEQDLTVDGDLFAGSLETTGQILAHDDIASTGEVVGLTGVRSGTGFYEQARTEALGTWQDRAFSAGDFAGTGTMTWTVNSSAVLFQRYCLVGQTLFYRVYIAWFAGTSTIAGTPTTQLVITPPAALRAANAGFYYDVLGLASVAGVATPLLVGQLGTAISVQRQDFANFAAGTVGFVLSFVGEVA